MKAIWEALESIVQILYNIGNFAGDIILNTGKAMNVITKVASESMELIHTLPDFLQIFATITIIISVTYLILGWAAGKSD